MQRSIVRSSEPKAHQIQRFTGVASNPKLQGRRENAAAKSSELQDASKTVAPDITGGRRLSGLSPLQNITIGRCDFIAC